MNQLRAVLLLSLGVVCSCGASDPPPTDGVDTSGASGSAGGVGTGGSSGGSATGASGSATGGSIGAAGGGTGGAISGGAGATGNAGAGGSSTGIPSNRPCGKLFYSGEPGEITLASGSTWSDPRGTAGTSTITEIHDNPHSGTTALEIALDWNDGQYGGDYGWSFGNYDPKKAIDASAATYLDIWMRADHVVGGFNIWINDTNKVSSTFHGVAGGTVGLEWKEIKVPMSAFAKTGFDLTHVDTFASDMHDDGNGKVTWYLDDGVFVTACP